MFILVISKLKRNYPILPSSTLTILAALTNFKVVWLMCEMGLFQAEVEASTPNPLHSTHQYTASTSTSDNSDNQNQLLKKISCYCFVMMSGSAKSIQWNGKWIELSIWLQSGDTIDSNTERILNNAEIQHLKNVLEGLTHF